MATDDERREVAERLRRYVKTYACPTWRVLCGVVLGGDNLNTVRMIQTLDRLADLIDPDTTTDTTKSPDVTTKCDREALLALAEEMQGYADVAASGDGYPYVNAGNLWTYADRIREACGVLDAG